MLLIDKVFTGKLVDDSSYRELLMLLIDKVFTGESNL